MKLCTHEHTDEELEAAALRIVEREHARIRALVARALCARRGVVVTPWRNHDDRLQYLIDDMDH